MPTLRALAATVMVLAVAGGAETQPEKTIELNTEDEKLCYALGMGIAGNFQLSGLFTEAETKIITQGLEDALLGREPRVPQEQYVAKLEPFLKVKRDKRAETMMQSGVEFLQNAAAEPGAIKRESGLVYQELLAGSGDHPGPTDKVTVHYTGSLIDGTVFDSSVQRNEPNTFGLNQVIKGWTEGIQLMKVGGKARLVIPSSIAYGVAGRPPHIPSGATLVFEVELLAIQ